MSCDLILCGWRVRSALALPELLPWRGDGREPDVEISFDAIPEPTGTPIFVRPHSRLWPDNTYLFFIDGVGRFWVEHGCRVLVEPAPGASEADLRVFLLGTVLGVLCHQRGLLPIHASAVRIDGRAVLIAGISGAGKSTLAAALGKRGHPLVADDVVAITPDGPMALPAFPQRKLAPDVLEALAMPHEGLAVNRPGQFKFRVPAPLGYAPEPLPPLAIYILGSDMPEQTGEIRRQNHVASAAQLDMMIYRRGIGLKIQTPQAVFRTVARLAQAAPVHILPLGKGLPLSGLGKLAERVESHILGLRP